LPGSLRLRNGDHHPLVFTQSFQQLLGLLGCHLLLLNPLVAHLPGLLLPGLLFAYLLVFGLLPFFLFTLSGLIAVFLFTFFRILRFFRLISFFGFLAVFLIFWILAFL
jgi:hypothetical protein